MPEFEIAIKLHEFFQIKILISLNIDRSVSDYLPVYCIVFILSQEKIKEPQPAPAPDVN